MLNYFVEYTCSCRGIAVVHGVVYTNLCCDINELLSCHVVMCSNPFRGFLIHCVVCQFVSLTDPCCLTETKYIYIHPYYYKDPFIHLKTSCLIKETAKNFAPTPARSSICVARFGGFSNALTIQMLWLGNKYDYYLVFYNNATSNEPSSQISWSLSQKLVLGHMASKWC